MPDPRTPIVRFVAATDAVGGVPANFTDRMGAVYMLNRGLNDVYVAFDAIPVNTDGNGRFRLPTGRALALDDIVFTTVVFRCPAGLTTQVDVIGLPRPGSAGMGFE
jgi:hypothetical protein